MDSDGTHDPSTGGCSSCMYCFKIKVDRKEVEEDMKERLTSSRRGSCAPSARTMSLWLRLEVSSAASGTEEVWNENRPAISCSGSIS
jgi:hypothetical protein